MKIYFTTVPVVLFMVVILVFVLFVKDNEDLISSSGDTILGKVLGMLFVLCIIADGLRFFRDRFKKNNSH